MQEADLGRKIAGRGGYVQGVERMYNAIHRKTSNIASSEGWQWPMFLRAMNLFSAVL